jgi:hypothetical protein
MSEIKATFKQVQEIFGEKNIKIEKEGRSYHYIVDEKIHLYMPKVKMAELVEIAKKVQDTEVLEKEYGYELLKEKKVSKAKEKKEKVVKEKINKKELKSNISNLEEELTELTLKIMALKDAERKTEKHFKLREALHSVYQKLVDLGERKELNKTA